MQSINQHWKSFFHHIFILYNSLFYFYNVFQLLFCLNLITIIKIIVDLVFFIFFITVFIFLFLLTFQINLTHTTTTNNTTKYTKIGRFLIHLRYILTWRGTGLLSLVTIMTGRDLVTTPTSILPGHCFKVSLFNFFESFLSLFTLRVIYSSFSD